MNDPAVFKASGRYESHLPVDILPPLARLSRRQKLFPRQRRLRRHVFSYVLRCRLRNPHSVSLTCSSFARKGSGDRSGLGITWLGLTLSPVKSRWTALAALPP